MLPNYISGIIIVSVEVGMIKRTHSVIRSWNLWKWWFAETEVGCITVLHAGVQ